MPPDSVLELSHLHPPFRESRGQSSPTASPQRGVQVCVEVACVCRGWSSRSSAEDPREVDSLVNQPMLLGPCPTPPPLSPNPAATAQGLFVGVTYTHKPTRVHSTRTSATHPQLILGHLPSRLSLRVPRRLVKYPRCVWMSMGRLAWPSSLRGWECQLKFADRGTFGTPEC